MREERKQEGGDDFTIAHYPSSSFSRWLSLSPPLISPSEVLPAFNECHPGCPPGVYFYDATGIRLTRVGERKRWQSEGENGTKRRLRSGNFFFFYVHSFTLPSSFSRSFSSSLSLFSPRLISPARMTLRGQVVGDSEILPAGSLLLYTECTTRTADLGLLG